MFFVKSDAGHSGEDSDIGVPRGHMRPRLGKTSDDRRLICNVGWDEFDELPWSLGEIGPSGGL